MKHEAQRPRADYLGFIKRIAEAVANSALVIFVAGAGVVCIDIILIAVMKLYGVM